MTAWDAVVVGAGPAGSVAAYELACRGAKVLVVDKARFPRPKVCGGCLSAEAVTTLEGLRLGDVPGSSTIDHIRLGLGGKNIDLPGDGLVIDRCRFDADLLAAAERAGAVVRTGVTAKIGPATTECRMVELNREERIFARIVVNAAGLSGNRGRPAARSRIGAGVTIPADRVPAFYEPGTVYMAVGRSGYVGLVRLDDGRLTVGASLDPGMGMGAAASSLIAETGWAMIDQITEFLWKGTPLLTRRGRPAGRRLFAVGDAASYVEPFTGEGMTWAITSAARLAPIAIRAVEDWSDNLAREWSATYRRRIGSTQWLCHAVTAALRSESLRNLGRVVLPRVPFLARPVVSLLNRK
jgi:flavin-dependent dehydrogenase